MSKPKIEHGGLTLTWNEKCSCYQFCLPPRLSCPGVYERLETPKSICNFCYAYYGRSQQMWAASQILLYNMETILGVEKDSGILCSKFLGVLGRIPERHRGYFRWMGCGDVPNLTVWVAMVGVAKGLPGTSFWCPTQNNNLLLASTGMPSNLTLRHTQHLMGEPAPENGLTTLLPEQKELPDHFTCPGKCGECRACWKTSGRVAFPFHGSATLMARFKKERRVHGF